MTRMGKTFLSLFVVGLLVQTGAGFLRASNNDNDDSQLQQQPTSFRAGTQYVFEYNGQIATGLMGPQDDQIEQSAGNLENSFEDENPQKSVTRLQAKVKINFVSDNRASLQLEQTRVGQLNGKSPADPKRVQPMAMFEKQEMKENKQRELQLPVEFIYADGVVERVNFHREDKAWSKNVKRAVINLIQVNLKRKNIDAQNKQNVGISSEENSFNDNNYQQQKWGKAFVIPETSIEGTCMTTYTINDNSKSSSNNKNNNNQNEESSEGNGQSQYNVTKTIDFKNCQQIADVGYGFHSQDEQSAKCARINNNNNYYGNDNNGNNKNRQGQYPTSSADESCDPKEVNEEKLERSTVHRVECYGNAQEKKCAIKRAEVRSHYVFKSYASQTDPRTASAMHTIAVSELIFRGVQSSSSGSMLHERDIETNNNNDYANANSLLYDNEWAVEEKRFYMLGDEGFNGLPNPFKSINNKVEQAQVIFQRLTQSTINKAQGIEGTTSAELQQLVELLRMFSVNELKSIQKTITSSLSQQQNRPESEKVEQLFANVLAIAGTRNTIQLLIQKIENGELSPVKAAACLKNLNRIPAPSDPIASIISGLCQSETIHRSPALQQSCWLTFGAMVGNICRDKISANRQQNEQQDWPQQQKQVSGQQAHKQQQQMLFGTQSGFDKTQVCSAQKKNEYTQILLEQYKQAENTYEKILALKAIGNAGLDNLVREMEKIATSQSESPAVRTAAIDALRRLRKHMPRKIQRVILPIFQNTNERAEVRMAAFQMLQNTQPEKPVFDQILYTLTKERSREVKSFVYSAIKSLSESKIQSEQNIAKHLKSALSLSGIDEEEASRASVKSQMPIHSADGKDGVVLKWVSIFGEKQMLPSHLAAGIDTIYNGNKNSESVKLSLTQQGTNRWLENVVEALFGRQAAQNMRESSQTRAGRKDASNSRQADEQLRDMYKKLGVKSRKQHNSLQSYRNSNGNSQQNSAAYAMLCLRVSDVDQAVLPLDEQTLPVQLKKVLEEAERFGSLSDILRQFAPLIEKQHFRSLSAMSFNEKTARIATSAGVSLKIAHSVPVLSCIEASAKVQTHDSSSTKVQVNAHAIITGVHMQSMEAWTPFGSSGVESTRALEFNVPLQMEVASENSNSKHPLSGLKFTWNVPQQQKTRLFGAHTLAFTYTRKYDGKNSMQRSAPKMLAIRNPTLDAILAPLNVMNKIVGQRSLNVPIHISGEFRTPNQPTDWAQWLQIAMSTENHVHVTLEPTNDTPRAITFRVSSALFQHSTGSQLTEALRSLKNFYDDAEQNFQPAYPEEFQNMEMDSFNQRRQKLVKFMAKNEEKYLQVESQNKKNKGQTAVYKHSIKLSVHTEGGRNNAKAQLMLDALCDARFSACAIYSDIGRTAIYANEATGETAWTFKANAQILMPESVSSPAELVRLGANKQQKFIGKMEAYWGSDRQQFVKIRVQGENVQRKQQQWNNEENTSVLQNKHAVAFINKFDATCDYKLQPYAQNFFSRVFDVLKTQSLWATQYRSVQSGRDGQVTANVIVEPLNAQQLSIQVRSQTQAVRIGGVHLPYSVRPMPLIKANEKSTHSIAQAFTRFAQQSTRAECTVDGRYVETFDGARFKGPITSSCYSVLAKDCSNSEQPQFAVLMKSLDQDGKQKKVKVITPDHVIECKPENNANYEQSKKIVCEINGKPINQQSSRVPTWGVSASSEEEQNKYRQTTPIVEYNNDEQTSVTITAPSGAVTVRFGCQCADCQCQKAWIQLSNKHKYAQCGLCGHFDDNASDEWRMGNNEQTTDLAEFHRSYTVMTDGEHECTEDNKNKFYTENKSKFEVLSRNSNQWIDQSSDEGMATASDEDQNEFSQEKQFFGGYAQESQSDEDDFYGGSARWNEKRSVEPTLKTKKIEHHHQVCFSSLPVKQCPSGYYPSSDDLDSNDMKTTNVNFVCMSRSEAAPFVRSMHRDGKVKLGKRSPNFVDSVQEPTKCKRA